MCSAIIWVLLNPMALKAQLANQVGNQIPKFLSPDASMFQKFVDVPVSEYTGVADITIPIHSVKVGNYTHDISLQYHSGGIKADDEASVVGLGWLLNAGGVINCIPAGMNDAECNPIKTDQELDDLLMQSYTKKTLHELFNENYHDFHQKYTFSSFGSIDKPERGSLYYIFNSQNQIDLFSFNFCGYSGRFVEGQDHQYHALNQADLLTVERENGFFIITDKLGIKYYFNQLERTSKTIGDAFSYSDSYYLTKIAFPDKAADDCIQFRYFNSDLKLSYTPLPSMSTEGTTERTEENDTQNAYIDLVKGARLQSDQVNKYTGSPVYLESIETKSELVKFGLSARLDIKGDAPRKLDSISVYSKYDGGLKKMYVLFNSYFEGNKSTREKSLLYSPYNQSFSNFTEDQVSKRLRLDSLFQVSSGDFKKYAGKYSFVYDNAVNRYTFAYENVALPYKKSTAIDHWGYYNGENNNILVPTFRFGKYEYPLLDDNKREAFIERQKTNGGANRGASPTFMKAGLLNKITYPTGGTTTIAYEPNAFSNYRCLSAEEIKSNVLEKVDEYRTNKNMDEGFFIEPDRRVTFSASFRCMYPPSCVPLSNVKGNTMISLVDKSSTPWTYLAQFSANQFDDWNRELQVTFTTDRRRRVNLVVQTAIPEGTPSVYPYPTQHVYASVRHEYALPNLNSKYSIGGGCRVAQICFYSNSVLQKKQVFCYESADGNSYGKLMVPLSYVSSCRQPGKDCKSIFQFFISQLNVADRPIIQYDGPVVGYSNVEIKEVDSKENSNGKTTKIFSNDLPVFSQEGVIFRVEQKPLNGSLSKVSYFDKEKLVKEQSFDMDLKQKTVAKNYSSFLKYDNEHWSSCRVGPRDSGPLVYEIDDWYLYVSPIYSYQIFKTKEYVKSYTDQGTISEESSYAYDEMGQLSSKSTKRSFGDIVTEKYYYPYNLAAAGNLYLHMGHMPGIVVKEERFVNDRQKEGRLLEYYYPSDGVYCPFRYSLWSEGKGYREEQQFGYGGDGYIKELKRKNGTSTSFIWGYNSTYPVAQFDNATYDDVSGKTSLVVQLQSYTNLTDAATRDRLKALNNSIRKEFPTNVLVTTYTYRPLVGITSKTTPNGATTYYEYDGFGRLTSVKDDKGNIVSKNDYNYYNDKNQ
nr:RHS repeat domain-containing protein [uncultured Acetobacteroides sp.]